MIKKKDCRSNFKAFSAVSAIALALAAAAQAEDQTKVFNIEAQPLSEALLEFSEQSKINVIAPSSVTNGLRAQPVSGELIPEEALNKLLFGSGLKSNELSTGAYTITLASAEVTEPTPQPFRVAQLDQEEDAGRVEQPVEPDSESERREDVIVVTGSRIRGAQSASPVTTISRDDIDIAGFATVEDVVQSLPQNFNAGFGSGNFREGAANRDNIVGGGSNELTAGGTSVNLRGLGAGSTLVLLNGRRMSPSGFNGTFTSISSIPVSAVERVEVLTDGASAIYGSDAIGGVINFILRDDFEGAETRFRYGIHDGGDAPNILVGQSFGHAWDSGNILLGYEYFDQDALANSDRDILSTNDLSRFGGTDYRSLGGNPANLRVTLPDGSRPFFAIPTGQDGTSLTPADFDPNAPLNLFNNREQGDFLPNQERHSAFLLLTQEVGQAEFFIDAQYSNEENSTRIDGAVRDLIVTDANPFFVDPTGTGLTSVRVDNYSFQQDIPSGAFGEIETFRAVAGVRYKISDKWDTEVAGGWARSDSIRGTFNNLDLDALETALNSSDPATAFNPFGDGPTDPAVLEGLIDRPRSDNNEFRNELMFADIAVQGELGDYFGGGATRLSAGGEFRNESIRSIDLTVPVFPRDFDLERDIWAAYGELFVPVVGSGNARPGIQALEFSVAGRYENYSDFGDTFNPKFGAVWAPTDSLLFRGTWGTSFKAPNLTLLSPNGPDRLFTQSLFVPDSLSALLGVPFNFLLLTGGNSDLDAEEATSWTAGLQWSPKQISGLQVDVTYFKTDFEGRIDIPTRNAIEGATDPRFASFITNNPSLEQIAAFVDTPNYNEIGFGFPTPAVDLLSGAVPVDAILDLRTNNIAESVVSGIEAQVSYSIDTDIGTVGAGLNGTYTIDFSRRLVDGDPLVNEVDQLGRPVDLRLRGNLSWRNNGWSASTFINYVDSYTDNVYEDPEREIEAWTTVDLTIGYEFDERANILNDTRVSISARNLFNEDPPFVNTIGTGFDAVNANPLGRVMSLQVTKSW